MDQEYKWEVEVYMEMWQLCFSPCMGFTLDLGEREKEKEKRKNEN
ncbi:unnamed protein product [marine sediment metagenome]|uniref:Uncharacterized protein n=1 Tax=marine sediment metagenome TaxID=412755 RepID=X1EHY9_9ZZZZ